MEIQKFTELVISRMHEDGIDYDKENIISIIFSTIESHEDLAVLYNDALIENDFTYVNAEIENHLQKIIPQIAS